jgi:hypothetical protein
VLKTIFSLTTIVLAISLAALDLIFNNVLLGSLSLLSLALAIAYFRHAQRLATRVLVRARR